MNDDEENYPLSGLKFKWLKSFDSTCLNQPIKTQVSKVFKPTNESTIETRVNTSSKSPCSLKISMLSLVALNNVINY